MALPARIDRNSRPRGRRLLGFNALTALALGLGGYALGHWVGSRIAIGMDSQNATGAVELYEKVGMHSARQFGHTTTTTHRRADHSTWRMSPPPSPR